MHSIPAPGEAPERACGSGDSAEMWNTATAHRIRDKNALEKNFTLVAIGITASKLIQETKKHGLRE
jgi:hypothetical protein